MRSFAELFDRKVRVRLKFPLQTIPDTQRQLELLGTLVETEGVLTAIEKIGRQTFICVGTSWINLEMVQHLQFVAERANLVKDEPPKRPPTPRDLLEARRRQLRVRRVSPAIMTIVHGLKLPHGLSAQRVAARIDELE